MPRIHEQSPWIKMNVSMKRSPVGLLLALLLVSVLRAQPAGEDARFKLAQGYEASGDYRNAARVYRELYERDPGSNAYFEGLRRTYLALQQYADLLPLAEDRVKKLPRDAELRSLYASLLHRTGKRAEAMEEWQNALSVRPDDPQVYDMVARSQLDVRLYHNAIETYTRGRAAGSDPAAFADQLAQLYGATGQYENAAGEYLLLLDSGEFNMNFVMAGLGLFTTNADGAEAAIKVVQRRLDARPDHLPYLQLLSWLYTERGDYDGAFETAKDIDRLRNGRGSDIYAFADRALREGRYESAIRALEYFRETYPKENPIYGNAVLAYTRALEGKYREGAPSPEKATELIGQYGTVVRENEGTVPAADALLQIARLQADDLDRVEDAIATIDEIRNDYPRFPSLPEALLLEGDLYLRLGDLERAGKLYETGAGNVLPGSMDEERYRDESALRRAEVLFYTGRFQEAEDAFNQLTVNISSPVANDALAYLFLLQENRGRNDSALQHFAAGSLLLLQHRWSEAAAEMDRAVASATTGSLSDEALFRKARAQDALAVHADAIATLLGIVREYPDGTVADRALFRAAELTEKRLGDIPAAIELYTRLLGEYPMSPRVNDARARIRELRGNS